VYGEKAGSPSGRGSGMSRKDTERTWMKGRHKKYCAGLEAKKKVGKRPPKDQKKKVRERSRLRNS